MIRCSVMNKGSFLLFCCHYFERYHHAELMIEIPDETEELLRLHIRNGVQPFYLPSTRIAKTFSKNDAGSIKSVSQKRTLLHDATQVITKSEHDVRI